MRTIAGAIIGEIALILLTTVAQEVLYDGISFRDSPPGELIFGGLATFVAAILAGTIASIVGGVKNYWPHVIISIVICAETIWLSTSRTTGDPVWFDLLAGSSLVVGVWLGYWLCRYINTFANSNSREAANAKP